MQAGGPWPRKRPDRWQHPTTRHGDPDVFPCPEGGVHRGHKLGRARSPEAKRLVITADCGGSNGARLRLWKRELQRFANETGLAVTVAHLPPGTSKWNRIEHRLFAYISQNWRGKPLVSHQVIVQLIGATTTQTGLTVRCELDANCYPKGIKITAAEMATLAITRDPFHGEWNYTISPNQQPP